MYSKCSDIPVRTLDNSFYVTGCTTEKTDHYCKTIFFFFYLVKNVPVIETEAEQWRFIRECHEGIGNSVEAKAMSGYFGRDKTVALIQSKVYFPGFRQKTIEFIKSCVACQRVKCGGKFEKW